MTDQSLVDIEERIYSKLASSCDIDQEARDYLNKNLKDISTFGVKEEENIFSSREKALSGTKQYLAASIIPLIKKIIELFSKTNLYSLERSSLEKTYLSSIFFFLSPLKQHSKILTETETIFAELLAKEKDYMSILELFKNIQKEQIQLLENIDKKILIGKSICHQFFECSENREKDIIALQGRVLQMELTKNISLQIITKIQGAEEIVITIINSINNSLAPDFSLYIDTYKNTLVDVKQKKERKDLKKLITLYQNILRDIKKLEILDEDLEEKFSDLKSSLPLLLK